MAQKLSMTEKRDCHSRNLRFLATGIRALGCYGRQSRDLYQSFECREISAKWAVNMAPHYGQILKIVKVWFSNQNMSIFELIEHIHSSSSLQCWKFADNFLLSVKLYTEIQNEFSDLTFKGIFSRFAHSERYGTMIPRRSGFYLSFF